MPGAQHTRELRRLSLPHLAGRALQAAELTEAQLSVVMAQLEARGECLADRAIPTEGKAPTLISLYQKTGGFSTKFVCEERDGTPRDGAPPHRLPRFRTQP